MKQLPVESYPIIYRLFDRVEINHLFARSVLERRVNGIVSTDNPGDPKVFHIKHPYGMSLLLGDPEALHRWDAFWSYLTDYQHVEQIDEWLQCWPLELSSQINTRLGLRPDDGTLPIEKHIRVNFKFDPLSFARQQRSKRVCKAAHVVRTGKKEYWQLTGSVIPGYFWADMESFLRDGIGFSVINNGIVVSTAFSAFVHDKMLELGIETHREHQGRGYAFEACSSLINHCMENGFEPIWSCRLDNEGSVRLAKKLGFTETIRIPYFRFPGKGNRSDQAREHAPQPGTSTATDP